MSYSKGDTVVVRGTGLGKVKRVGAGGAVEVLLSEDEADVLELTPDGARKRIRPVVDRATAEGLLEVLSRKEGQPDGRPWGEQYVELQRVQRAGDAARMAERLQRLYRARRPLPAAVERAIHKFEDVLLPELAHVLGKTSRALRSQLHKGQPAFGYSAPERPEDLPAALPTKLPAGWKCLGTFRVFSGRLVVGEAADSDFEATFPGRTFHTNLTAKARNGDWFAMVKEEEWAGVFVHAGAVAGFEARLAESRELGKVVVDGGTLCVLDEEVRGDRSFHRAQELASNEAVEGRGFVVATGGDGVLLVRGAFEGKEAVLVAAPHE